VYSLLLGDVAQYTIETNQDIHQVMGQIHIQTSQYILLFAEMIVPNYRQRYQASLYHSMMSYHLMIAVVVAYHLLLSILVIFF